MSGWGAGYVTDIAYLPGYYRQQSPQHMHLACLLGGVAGIEAPPDAPFVYMELGCGFGFGATVLAASNPGWRVIGVDFAPAHIAAARALAAEAGVSNATFVEADLATLAATPLGRALPEADAISVHGVWSWVPQPVRDGIVAVLRDKLRAGGVAHLSYNALPGWQSAIGLQRTLREAGRTVAARSDRQALTGFETVKALAEAGAVQLNFPMVRDMLSRLGNVAEAYLAHEYMNEAWSPCFHADVVRAVGEARLDWVASAELIENFPELALTDDQRAVMGRFEAPLMRELVKDMCLNRALRHDVFVRGARRLDRAARDAALRQVRLALTCAPEAFVYEAEVPAGQASLTRDFYAPIVAELARGPRLVGDLLELSDVVGSRDNPAELVGLMVGTEQAIPVTGEPCHGEAAPRFNTAALRWMAGKTNLNAGAALATAGLGSPLPCSVLDAHICTALRNGARDSAAVVTEIASDRSPDERSKLAQFIERRIIERAAAWRGWGLV